MGQVRGLGCGQACRVDRAAVPVLGGSAKVHVRVNPESVVWVPSLVTSCPCQPQRGRGYGCLCLCFMWVLYVGAADSSALAVAVSVTYCIGNKTAPFFSAVWEYLRLCLHKFMSGMDRKHYITGSWPAELWVRRASSAGCLGKQQAQPCTVTCPPSPGFLHSQGSSLHQGVLHSTEVQGTVRDLDFLQLQEAVFPCGVQRRGETAARLAASCCLI